MISRSTMYKIIALC